MPPSPPSHAPHPPLRLPAARARIDWGQLWYPGPKRAFSAAEMARAGSDAPSPTLLLLVATTLGFFGLAALLLAPDGQRGPVVLLLAVLTLTGAAAARWLWWNPWRRPLMQATIGVALAYVVLALLLRWLYPERAARGSAGQLLGLGGGVVPTLLWFLVVWRAQQIEARLREQAERERAVEMAQRLAAAQLEPHFLFNTLASLQHWVQTRDERAAPLLESLVGYLRATLPMFNRPLQPVADELEAVSRYLEVMAARFGPRLRYRIDVPPALQQLPLPPGLLLTLVENAVEHGIEPRLDGGTVTLTGRREGAAVLIEVSDDGAGPPAALHDGIGLANSRERLGLAYGDRARLEIGPGPAGGCLARVRVSAEHETGTEAR